EALGRLATSGHLDNAALIIVSNFIEIGRLPFETFCMNEFRDELSIALLFAACDLVVVPSRQENLPNIALEALACGRPSVGFPIGGLTDIIRHGSNGLLARDVSAEALAAALKEILGDTERLEQMKRGARRDALERYAFSLQPKAYAELFGRLIAA